MNIIQLGLVRDITIENDIARLKMILTTPFCPYGPAMIEMTKAKAVEGLEHAGHDRNGHGHVGLLDDGRPVRVGLGHVRLSTVYLTNSDWNQKQTSS